MARQAETQAQRAGEHTLPNTQHGDPRCAESKAARRDGRQEGRDAKTMPRQSASEVPSVSARARQGTQTGGRDWSWVDATVWTERMLTALENGVKGGCWFSLIDKVYRGETLRGAWQKVQANAGAAGVDGQSVERFALRAEQYLGELEQALRSGTYQALPVRRVEIDKGAGKTRPLGIPAVKDRVVQTAVKRVIEPIFECEFCEHSYGFRPGRSAKDALREVDGLLKQGYTHVVDADLVSYFDTIPKAALLAQVAKRISDGAVLKLIGAYLDQEIVHGMRRWKPTAGTPQGAVLSPLLANLYLHPLDCVMEEAGYRMTRYADDFVVLCQTAQQAQQALADIQRWVESNGLKLHPEKTHIGDCRVQGQGFEFLGYRFEAGRRWVRRKSWQAIRERLRARTRRTRGQSVSRIIADINPMLRGWFGYFKHAHPLCLHAMDGFIRRRLRAILRKQMHRPGRGRCLADHKRWPKAYFADLGLFTLGEALVIASQSR
jgi:RNA-directed DNA polymerase